MKRFVISAIGAFVCTFASAQWTFQPIWGNRGTAEAVDDYQVVGAWSPTSGSREGVVLDLSTLTLTPGLGAAQGSGVIFGVHNGQQVGRVQQDMFAPKFAALWTGTPASFTSLHPAFTSSTAYDVYEGVQVGEVVNSGVWTHAALWTGTPGSWVDLNPIGASYSSAIGVYENVQVGIADDEAAMWTGTPGSYVNLHPPGWFFSSAIAVHGNQQVGFTTNHPETIAALWYGSAATYVNLHPAGFEESIVNDVHSGQQVGNAINSGNPTAAYWTGSAASFVNLDDFMPASWTLSEANSIWDNGDITRIVGAASLVGDRSAVMWTRQNVTVPVANMTIVRGGLVSGGTASIVASDNDYLAIRPGPVLSSSQDPILIHVIGFSPQLNPTMLSFFVEANSTGGAAIRQTLLMYDFDAQTYEEVDVRQVSVTDKLARATITDDPGRFIGPAGEVDARVAYRATAPVLSFPWETRIDRIRWIVPGT